MLFFDSLIVFSLFISSKPWAGHRTEMSNDDDDDDEPPKAEKERLTAQWSIEPSECRVVPGWCRLHPGWSRVVSHILRHCPSGKARKAKRLEKPRPRNHTLFPRIKAISGNRNPIVSASGFGYQWEDTPVAGPYVHIEEGSRHKIMGRYR